MGRDGVWIWLLCILWLKTSMHIARMSALVKVARAVSLLQPADAEKVPLAWNGERYISRKIC